MTQAKPGDKVAIEYEGVLENGEVFESTAEISDKLEQRILQILLIPVLVLGKPIAVIVYLETAEKIERLFRNVCHQKSLLRITG